MKRHIVCLGDSNTHGLCADPADCADHSGRFNEEERWTCLLQKKLGDPYRISEEGLSNRTTCFDDPLNEGVNALAGVSPLLMSHGPVDLLIVMLGTNDTKDYFRASPACIALGLARLVKKAMATDCWGGKKPNILVVAPTPIGPEYASTPTGAPMGPGCAEKSRALAGYYREQCGLLGVHFLDAREFGCQVNRVDYIHLTKKGHAALAEGLAAVVPTLL